MLCKSSVKIILKTDKCLFFLVHDCGTIKKKAFTAFYKTRKLKKKKKKYKSKSFYGNVRFASLNICHQYTAVNILDRLLNWVSHKLAIWTRCFLLVSLAATVTLCQFAVSRSKALATVIVPLFGSILKAFVVSLLLSIEYLEEKSQRHTGCFLGKQNIVMPQGD